MGVALSRSGDESRIELDGAIDITVAAELKAALLDALAGGKAICVSTEAVTDLDVTGWQLLWAARREALRSGIEFRLHGGLPERLQESLKRCGLWALGTFAECAGGAEAPNPELTEVVADGQGTE